MFIPAGELLSSAAPLWGDKAEVPDEHSDGAREETDQELWERKAVEARLIDAERGGPSRPFKKTLYNSIKERGVSEPVRLMHREDESLSPEVANGHHRIAAAAEIDPEMLIPVEHYDPVSNQMSITHQPGDRPDPWRGLDDGEYEAWDEKVMKKLGRW
jgi:hypothetical protein